MNAPKQRTPQPAILEPNYQRPCLACDQVPTVDIQPVRGGAIRHTDLCGPCTWGEANTLDPDNW